MTFTTKTAIKAYLTQNPPGSAGVLTATVSDPLTTSSGIFGHQVLTIKLNTLRDAAYGTQVYTAIVPSPWDGLSVNAILADANTVLGGGPSAYSTSSQVPKDLTAVLGAIVSRYHCGLETTD